MGDDRIKLVAYAAAALLLTVAAVRASGGCGGSGTAGDARLTLDDEQSSMRSPAPGRPGASAYVHVAGEVRRPGLYRVPAAARAGVAVERAGGLTSRADGTALNLAARVRDGQQLVVPRRGVRQAPGAGVAAPPEPPAPNAAATAPGETASAKIRLSTATLEQLDTLDGIGPALAKRILAYRDQHGGFRSVEQLKEVEGIGEKRFEALRRAVVP